MSESSGGVESRRHTGGLTWRGRKILFLPRGIEICSAKKKSLEFFSTRKKSLEFFSTQKKTLEFFLVLFVRGFLAEQKSIPLGKKV